MVNPDQLNELFIQFRLNAESEAYLIHFENSLNLESEISIFQIEETDDDVIF